MKVATYSKAGAKATAQVDLPKDVFEVEVGSKELLHLAQRAFEANQRGNSAKSKDRSEIRGGGRKPWKQKGTGRARHGSIRSPLWRGGGVTFGPTGIENYTVGMNRKQLQKALAQSLSLKADAGSVSVIDALELKDHKTSGAVAILDKIKATGKVLIIDEVFQDQAKKAFRNISNVVLKRANDLHAAMIIDADNILITKEALKSLDARIGAKK